MADKHAVMSISGSHRWLRCPGSIAANADKPWEQNIYALEGTTAHALLEVCLRLHTDPEEFLGQVLEEGLMPIDEDMVDAVGYALDYVKSYTADKPNAVVTIEKPVYPAKLLGVDDRTIWGTPDIQIADHPKELVTIDYKHGTGNAVNVKDNSQLKLYHLGRRAADGKYRRYRSVIIQPRLRGRRPVQEATLLDADLTRWADEEVRPVIPLAMAPNAPRTAGDWCRYCHASGRCPAQLKQTMDKAAKEFKDVDPKFVTPAELARYLDMLPALETATTALKEHAVRVAHAGVEIPGYVPSWTRTRRVWRDEEQANTLMAELGVPTKERYTVKLISPTEAEKVLREHKLIAAKKRGQPKPESPLEEVIARTEPNPSIDKRLDN